MRVRNAGELGLLVKDARLQAGLTQQEVAEQARVQRTWLSRLEAGDANPTFDTLLRVLGAVGVEIDLGPASATPEGAHVVDTVLEQHGASRSTDMGTATPYVPRMAAAGTASRPSAAERQTNSAEAVDAGSGEDDDIPDDVLARLLGSA